MLISLATAKLAVTSCLVSWSSSVILKGILQQLGMFFGKVRLTGSSLYWRGQDLTSHIQPAAFQWHCIECSCFVFNFLSRCRCVELIICEQMNKYRVRLKDINSLEFAESKAKSRLTLIRRSMVKFKRRHLLTVCCCRLASLSTSSHCSSSFVLCGISPLTSSFLYPETRTNSH